MTYIICFTKCGNDFFLKFIPSIKPETVQIQGLGLRIGWSFNEDTRLIQHLLLERHTIICLLDVKKKLRNNLINRIQQLSTDRLTEISDLLNKIENQLKSTDKTLQLAGTWKDLDDDIFMDLTEKLHENRRDEPPKV